MALFETLIGGLVTTAGNHRCMLPDREACPAASAASLRPPGCAVRRQAPVAAGAAGSAVSGLAGARPHCCEPGGWRAPGGGPGDLAGRKTSTWKASRARQGCSAHSCRNEDISFAYIYVSPGILTHGSLDFISDRVQYSYHFDRKSDRRIGMRDKRHPPWYGCAHIAPFGVPAIWQVAVNGSCPDRSRWVLPRCA